MLKMTQCCFYLQSWIGKNANNMVFKVTEKWKWCKRGFLKLERNNKSDTRNELRISTLAK